MKVYKKFNNTRSHMAKDFINIYDKYIPIENKKILLKISSFNDNVTLIEKIKLVFDNDFKTKKFKSNLKFYYDIFKGNI